MVLLFGRYLRQQASGRIYARAQNARRALRGAYDRAFDRVDILAMPTTPRRAVRAPEASATPVERMLASLTATANTAPFDLSGHPSLSVPCGSVDGLPVGLMLTGRHFEEASLLRAAHALEQSGLHPPGAH